jgi:hypothetical protein
MTPNPRTEPLAPSKENPLMTDEVRCRVCSRPAQMRLDDTVKTHQVGGARCDGSLQPPAGDPPCTPSYVRNAAGRFATFDARVFTIPDPVEVANYFLWRQRDAVRNSISMAAQAHFSHRQLHKVNTDRMQELLWSQAGINWNDYPAACKRGQVTVRKVGEREVTYTDRRTKEQVVTTATRSWWETDGAPHFTAQPDGWLADVIPPLPSLKNGDGS